MQAENKVTIVHIFTEAQTSVLNLIENNSKFLKQHNVEYMVFDNLADKNKDFLLKQVSSSSEFQNKNFQYIKENIENSDKNINFKKIFLSGANLTTHSNFFFVLNNTEININNVFEIEKTAPLLQKKDLDFFIKNVPEIFDWSKFNLYMKKNKTVLDKIKLLF